MRSGSVPAWPPYAEPCHWLLPTHVPARCRPKGHPQLQQTHRSRHYAYRLLLCCHLVALRTPSRWGEHHRCVWVETRPENRVHFVLSAPEPRLPIPPSSIPSLFRVIGPAVPAICAPTPKNSPTGSTQSPGAHRPPCRPTEGRREARQKSRSDRRPRRASVRQDHS
jgi:hypothetical protein